MREDILLLWRSAEREHRHDKIKPNRQTDSGTDKNGTRQHGTKQQHEREDREHRKYRRKRISIRSYRTQRGLLPPPHPRVNQTVTREAQFINRSCESGLGGGIVGKVEGTVSRHALTYVEHTTLEAWYSHVKQLHLRVFQPNGSLLLKRTPPLPYLRGHGRDRQADRGRVDALLVGKLASHVDPAVYEPVPALHHGHAQLAVVQEKRVALFTTWKRRVL